ncbi:flagellar basal body rod protein FlgB [Celerinatantimonas diazotrophica]|uniref:Flagellar basal body rod protein FlgB n=1 Tax=Celerinatantimonas diazotrophica TaxID=412034 RepID=A0A4R1JM72_9GAMM|nr:flagellar basal body rod protein FlgB [Celerinatantimonas diazotrophica]TCK52174.1 flagellar basal-body rod protein FlgB [Celerinatantimonas diazotrophica]CAG9296121.1 Flagellar basal body rod protein FlgB [Celerinatantimonas diazotrophica]
MSITFDKAFGIHQYTLGVRERRAELLASNIANADTPNYKARDLDFKKALAEATSGHDFRLLRTNERHIAGSADFDPSIGYRVPDQPDTGDGNTVDMQTEKTLYMENGMRYEASLNFLNSKINGLKKAITG